MKMLFIGGPVDGEYYHVDEAAHFWDIPERPDPIVRVCENPQTIENRTFKVYRYRKDGDVMRFNGGQANGQ